ncbi:MAG: hypothetical protein R3F48_14680 [Candidatus Zixiibacteriota bacterium]
MKNRRKRPFAEMETRQWLKAGSIVYISLSLVILVFSAILYLYTDNSRPTQPGTFFSIVNSTLPAILWIGYLAGLGFLIMTMRKCVGCILGPGKRLTSAMEKLGRGDVGWKLTLRRGDEMADVAESVSKASRALADRISKMQSEVKGIMEVEDYLIDSIAITHGSNPFLLKALRKLKISTTRLKTDINDFQVSATDEIPVGFPERHIARARSTQSVGGQ